MVVDYLHLVPEQQGLLADMPFEGHHLITGPPGSGKSLLAVQRAVMLALTGAPVTLLTATRAQRRALTYMLQLLGPTVEVQVTAAEAEPGTWRPGHPDRADAALVVDEAHTLPAELLRRCAESVPRTTVFAEELPVPVPGELGPDELARLVPGVSRHRLSVDHRTSRQIALLARHFVTERDRATPVAPPASSASSAPATPSATPSATGAEVAPPARTGPVPALHAYDGPGAVARHVLDHARAHPYRRIGVIVTDESELRALLPHLAARLPGERLWFGPGPGDAPDPVRPGVRVLVREAARGLEFDTVFVPDTHRDDVPGQDAAATAHAYVRLITRARAELHLGYAGGREPALPAAVPPELLTRGAPAPGRGAATAH